MDNREKVAKWLYEREFKYQAWELAIPDIKDGYKRDADNLLALIQPSPESAGGLSQVPVEFEREPGELVGETSEEWLALNKRVRLKGLEEKKVPLCDPGTYRDPVLLYRLE